MWHAECHVIYGSSMYVWMGFADKVTCSLKYLFSSNVYMHTDLRNKKSTIYATLQKQHFLTLNMCYLFFNLCIYLIFYFFIKSMSECIRYVCVFVSSYIFMEVSLSTFVCNYYRYLPMS